MKPRRALIALAAAGLALAAAACSRKASPTGASAEAPASAAAEPAAAEPAPSTPVVLRFWHSMSGDAGRAFDGFVREYNDGPGKTRGITVDAVFQGQYADAAAKLRPLLQAGDPDALPDLMQLDATAMVDYLHAGAAFTVDDALAAFPGTLDLADLLEPPLMNWNYGGRQLGLPLSASTTVLYYNKTLLDEAGVDAPPATFADIARAAARLPEQAEGGRRLTALALVPNSALLANWIGQIPPPGDPEGSSFVVDLRNGRDGDPRRLVCGEDGTLERFLEAWKALYDAGAVLNAAEGASSLFVAGQTCFLVASTSQIEPLLAQIGGRFEMGCAALPRIDSGCRPGAAVSGSGLFLFRRDGLTAGAAGAAAANGRLQAAWDFARYLVSPDVQAQLAAATGYIPVSKKSFDTAAYRDYAAKRPQAAVGPAQLAVTSPALQNLTVGPAREFYYEVQTGVSRMLTENKTPADAARDLTTALTLLLDDYAEANGP